MKKLNESIGWYGVIAVLTAYFLVGLSFWASTNPFYQILNLTGSLGLMYISVRKKAFQLGAFYFFWAIIALVSLIGILS